MYSSYDIIKRPIVTEKSMAQIEDKKYTFEVPLDVNKIQIRKAVEELFKGTKVKSVHTLHVLGKTKRQGRNIGKKSDWKKAIVQLTEDSKTIEFFDGMS